MSAFHLPFGKERTKRSYIATAAFSTGFYSYDKTGTALNPVYTLNAGAAGTSGATVGNCTVGRILRENGRKLYPGGAYPGVTTLMVGVFFTDQSGPANNFVSGYINPNSSLFAVFNSDKPIEVVDGTDAANSLVNRGPSVYTSGTVTALGSVSAGTSVTAGTYLAGAVVPLTLYATGLAGAVYAGASTADIFINPTLGNVFTVSLPAATAALNGNINVYSASITTGSAPTYVTAPAGVTVTLIVTELSTTTTQQPKIHQGTSTGVGSIKMSDVQVGAINTFATVTFVSNGTNLVQVSSSAGIPV